MTNPPFGLEHLETLDLPVYGGAGRPPLAGDPTADDGPWRP